MAMKQTEARAIARSAYVFLYPLVVNYGTMYVEALDPTSPFFAGGFGEWTHQRVTTSTETAVAAVHATTTRETAWLDLRSEPWTLSMPAIDTTSSRVAVTADLWDFLLDETGPDEHVGRTLLLVSPEWTGEAPADVERVVRGESGFVRIEVETHSDEPGDLDRVRMSEQTITLAPWSPRPSARPAAAAAISWWPHGQHALTDLMRAAPGPALPRRRSRETTDLDYFHRTVGALTQDRVAQAASSPRR